MVAQHGVKMRGLEAAGKTKNKSRPKEAVAGTFESRFGRMFVGLPAAYFTEKALKDLGAAMVSEFDAPKDGPDPEESGIPALYTYFGQFIDHDLTFGPEGSFQKQKDLAAVIDFRSAAFDLDNIYGRGPGDQPYMYAEDGMSFLLGAPLRLGNPGAFDLQRNIAGRALIGDPRNDENAIVSQLQGLFLRFHNRVIRQDPAVAALTDPVSKFEKAQEIVRKHYQYIVMNDFLPRIVHASVLDGLRTNGKYDKNNLRFFKEFDSPFMPVEFSVAAYRLGHSMVRPGYRLNDATLLPIFDIPSKTAPFDAIGFPEGLTGFRNMTPDWGIDWGRMIDIDARAYGKDPDTLSHDPKQEVEQKTIENFFRLQFAYKIDTALVDPLGSLPIIVAGAPRQSLAFRNLQRGVDFGLPSGQMLAEAMGVAVLPDSEIRLGQAVKGAKHVGIKTISDGAFVKNCPLWTYILAEATHYAQTPDPALPVTGGAQVSTPQLGPVGGGIVAETFLGLMFADKFSYLSVDPDWTPNGKANYQLKDFVNFALGL